MSDKKLEKEVAALLLLQPRKKGQWQFLESAEKEEREATKKEANKFLFWCIMSRQLGVKAVAENSTTMIESSKFLGDPDDLWNEIVNVPMATWKEWWVPEKFHSVPEMGACHRKNAHTILAEYEGDARNLWRNGSQCQIAERLRKLSGIGLAISNMTIGALRDTLQIDLPWSDVKPDTHVRRVLSRVFQGCDKFYNDEEVVKVTRRMHEDPWQLDTPLFLLGRNVCMHADPTCGECYLNEVCKGRRR